MADQEKTYVNIKGMKVTNVRKLGDKGVIVFSLNGNGLGLYNLRVVPSSRGDFISTPQSKGTDGKYYAQYQVYFSTEDEARVIKAVKEKLPKDEPADDSL